MLFHRKDKDDMDNLNVNSCIVEKKSKEIKETARHLLKEKWITVSLAGFLTLVL